jgi:hypothetical protein
MFDLERRGRPVPEARSLRDQTDLVRMKMAADGMLTWWASDLETSAYRHAMDQANGDPLLGMMLLDHVGGLHQRNVYRLGGGVL